MKGLNQFLNFDWSAFAEGKQFIVTGLSEYQDFETKAHLGTKVDCIIALDKTPYVFKDGKEFTNRFEKISFKVSKDMNIPLESRVMPKNVVASIYGEYRNQLSVKCDDIVIATSKEK
ncbi:MAG: hypothetical protein IJ763_04880 [Lachnospiraceae bacterium]|nr:hypothetical protein [Lachnospiraceae bacterium]